MGENQAHVSKPTRSTLHWATKATLSPVWHCEVCHSESIVWRPIKSYFFTFFPLSVFLQVVTRLTLSSVIFYIHLLIHWFFCLVFFPCDWFLVWREWIKWVHSLLESQVNPLPQCTEISSPKLGIFKIHNFDPNVIQLFVKKYSCVKMLSIFSTLCICSYSNPGQNCKKKMFFNRQPSPALLKHLYF